MAKTSVSKNKGSQKNQKQKKNQKQPVKKMAAKPNLKVAAKKVTKTAQKKTQKNIQKNSKKTFSKNAIQTASAKKTAPKNMQKNSAKKNPSKNMKKSNLKATQAAPQKLIAAKKPILKEQKNLSAKNPAQKTKQEATKPAVKTAVPTASSATAKPTTEAQKLAIGQEAPDFNLKNQAGETVSLNSLKGKNVVLYFYPKDMTPGCTQEACDFRDSLNRIQSQGAIVLGLSKDDEALHQKFIQQHNLNFDLLADTSGTVCNAYDVIKEKNMYGKKSMGIERTTYLINKEGKIAKIYPKVKVEGHVQEVINDLAQIN